MRMRKRRPTSNRAGSNKRKKAKESAQSHTPECRDTRQQLRQKRGYQAATSRRAKTPTSQQA
jgi:hypothetical protein